MEERQKLISYIAKNADKRWIDSFIHDVIEFDWIEQLSNFGTETLQVWAKELGYGT